MKIKIEINEIENTEKIGFCRLKKKVVQQTTWISLNKKTKR